MTMKTTAVKPHNVLRYGQVLYQGYSHDDCYVWILNHQPQSVHWAMKWEGYEIKDAFDCIGLRLAGRYPNVMHSWNDLLMVSMYHRDPHIREQAKLLIQQRNTAGGREMIFHEIANFLKGKHVSKYYDRHKEQVAAKGP